MKHPHHVVIVGAGLGGLMAAQSPGRGLRLWIYTTGDRSARLITRPVPPPK